MLYTQRCSPPRLSSAWLPRQRQDGRHSPQLAFPVPEHGTMKTSDGQTPKEPHRLHCASHFLGCWARLWSAVFSSAPLHLAWDRLGLGSAQAWLASTALLPRLLPAPVLQRVRSAGLSCVCCLELRSSRGMGRDGQRRERDKVRRDGPGNFPEEETEQNGPASRARSLFLLPQATLPRDEVHGIE